MIKKLSLIAVCALLAGNGFADQTVYKVMVNNNSNSIFPPGTDLYLTQAYEVTNDCKVYWPDSALPVGQTTTFTLRCDGKTPFHGLKLTYITNTTRSKGQTCWGTYYTSQPIMDPTANIAIYHDFMSYGTCGNLVNPPPILLSHPDPGK